MKNLARKFLKRFIKIETKQVYCFNSNKYVNADYWSLFGFYIGTKYTDIQSSDS